VRLSSGDPTRKPIIRHNYYADPEDLETMKAGVRLMLEIAAQQPLRRYCVDPYNAPADDSDAALRAHIEGNTQTIYHPVGTCAMGAVVDATLRVMGVEGLRVIDASVLPTVPRGNTNAPVIALAERASDLLRGREPLHSERPAAATSALP
jgi:choline dehydrogenase